MNYNRIVYYYIIINICNQGWLDPVFLFASLRQKNCAYSVNFLYIKNQCSVFVPPSANANFHFSKISMPIDEPLNHRWITNRIWITCNGQWICIQKMYSMKKLVRLSNKIWNKTYYVKPPSIWKILPTTFLSVRFYEFFFFQTFYMTNQIQTAPQSLFCEVNFFEVFFFCMFIILMFIEFFY